MDLDVRNVLIYVDDAVRYEALADDLAALGPTYKTVAASTHTPTSFGSLLTGLYPPAAGVLSFKHSPAAGVRSVFDIEDHTVTMGAKGGMNDSIAEMFGRPPRTTIEDVEPPFVHVTRRPGGHTPYDGFDLTIDEFRSETGREYFFRTADTPAKARREYYDGVRTSFEEFQRVVDVLGDRGLAEETLVVYTSDHGELLGEYGFFGHTHLATPEIVYVPTTFCHPDLEPSAEPSLLHHVDLLPTVASVLGDAVDIGRTHGTAFGGDRTVGYNHFKHVRYGSLPNVLETVSDATGGFERAIQSLWDRDGGHVFTEGSKLKTSIVYLGLLARAPQGRQILHSRRVRDVYSRFVPGHRQYGSPGFSKTDAWGEINDTVTEATTSEDVELDEETAERLRDMGYL
jgi:hypothetical protein